MNLYHDRQLYNTLIPPLHESPAVGLWVDLWVNTMLYHARHPL